MPYKKKGGKSHRKGKKSNNHNNQTQIIYKDENSEYAIVESMKGGGRCMVILPDSTSCLAIIPGKMKRRSSWIYTNDLLLVGKREYQKDRCDVLCKYDNNQVNLLKKKNVIPESFIKKLSNFSVVEQNVDSNITFQDSDDEDYSSSMNMSISDSDDINKDIEEEVKKKKKEIKEEVTEKEANSEEFNIDWDLI